MPESEGVELHQDSQLRNLQGPPGCICNLTKHTNTAWNKLEAPCILLKESTSPASNPPFFKRIRKANLHYKFLAFFNPRN